MKTLLVIGYVWPEPTSSAAGSRMMELLQAFKQAQYTIVFASPAQTSANAVSLETLGITTVTIKVNDESFDAFVKEVQPDVVLFDRFMMEEQFGWRITQQCPNTLKLLDTEDLHSLRKARHEAVKKKVPFTIDFWKTQEVTKREMAAILRCDISLIISEVEMDYLQTHFQIPQHILWYYPLRYAPLTPPQIQAWPRFKQRQHFITIGNFMHQPNWDAVLQLKTIIWPLIKQQLPQAEMHVYGAYMAVKHEQLHQPKEGFLMKGWAPNAAAVMQQAKVCLAPLRFGAGLKGKLMEAMGNGTPTVTTTIGAEGMHGDMPWNGDVVDDMEMFAHKAVQLYTHEADWKVAQQNGIDLIQQRFSDVTFATTFIAKVSAVQHNLTAHRTANFMGSMLQHHSLQSTKYMAKWIEAKNKL
ncbi:glycosyltransferase family 4 protein [Zhouia sp. PK063]|uniref:glycosyltransferase family 4 protein n=1 Tax=Zhouia sp. PK063 TaxID=3373602 RepID=UPI00378977EC